MDKQELIKIVGINPLNDPAQLDGYRELLGLIGHKPFECVGEIDESRWAFKTLSTLPDWQNDIAVKTLSPLIPDIPTDNLFTPSQNHLIPKDLSNALDEFKR